MFAPLLLLALGHATAAPAPLPQATPAVRHTHATDPNRQVCVTDTTLGSLVSTSRTCHTAAEWERMRADTATELRQNMAKNGPH